jgi:hypothetical protein
MTQYDDRHWIKHFRVNKKFVQQLTMKLKSMMEKKNTTFRFAVLMSICVACNLYKLVHASQYLHCFEFFAIKISTMHLVLHEFVCATNVVLKIQLKWLVGDDLVKVMAGFKDLCGLPSVHGAIDATHIHLKKPKGEKFFVADFYSFKFKGYNIQMQVVIDHCKMFRNVLIGVLGSMNGARILWISSLYH